MTNTVIYTFGCSATASARMDLLCLSPKRMHKDNKQFFILFCADEAVEMETDRRKALFPIDVPELTDPPVEP